jgi:hypothetical protein
VDCEVHIVFRIHCKSASPWTKFLFLDPRNLVGRPRYMSIFVCRSNSRCSVVLIIPHCVCSVAMSKVYEDRLYFYTVCYLRMPPKWDFLEIASFMLIRVHIARIMLWQYCATTFETFFLGSTNKIRYPFDFCGKNTFLYDLPSSCHSPDIIDHASRIDIAHSLEETDPYSLFHVLNNSMDKLLTIVPTTNFLPDPGWTRYLELWALWC